MELVYTYVKKYASANYHSCVDEPLKSQCKVLLSQCQQHNSRLGKQLKKKVKKERLANEIAVLLRITFISEQMEGKWEAERSCLGEEIEKISENLLKIATASSSEMDDLLATAGNLSERNSELQEQLQRCSMDCDMKSKLLESLRLKVSEMEELVMSLERKLANAHPQLLTKEQCIVSLNEHKGTHANWPISVTSEQNNSLITIQERLTLCQILGEFNALESPVNENLADAEVWRKELQRIVDSRDNGMSDLQQMRFRRGDDPILFCSEYLALYTKVFNCPDLLEDDTSFIYSMANKCY
ncbi:hypothetical protein AB205_0010960, partial [Aquarana catesbeiana]